MDLKDVAKDLGDQNSYRLDQRFDELMRKNPRYRNLDGENRELIFDLIKKYREKIRKGIKPSGYSVRQDMYGLYRKRLKLNLTYNDLDQIRDLLESFKG